ncbi:hypothetical protein GCM10010466_25350 [Planomonospora alba]|uniref:Uncharacterized protein n=1 Tax=Planomonospora alba TaxID=161354 RepID=A0ABP6N374_9ACTN
MPVAAQIMQHAAAHPHRVAVRGAHGETTYDLLARRIDGAARLLAARGAAPGAPAAIALQDPVEALVAVLAADLAGATPLVCDAAAGAERRARLLGAVPVDLRVERPLPVGPAAAGAARPAPAARPEERGPAAADPPAARAGAPHDRAWACFTSGSTGRPRAVVRTRASWTDSFPHLSDLARIGPDDTVLVPGPLSSSLYGFAAVHTLAVGATAVLPGRWPAAGLQAHLRACTAVHLVPHHLPAVLEVLRRSGGPLRSVVAGGAALPAGVRERAADADVHVLAYYGATELSFVAADADGCGLRPFPGVEIEVRAVPGAAASTGAAGGTAGAATDGVPLGEVWARSPYLADGYLAGADGPLRTDAGGWMTVGDLAGPYRGGQVLRLRGRGGGAIQTGGATVVPEDVEEVLRKAPGVGDVVVVGLPHPDLGAVVAAVVEGTGVRRAALEEVARAELDAAQRPRRWYAAERLPRTPSGKPRRGLLAARLAGGEPGIRKLG